MQDEIEVREAGRHLLAETDRGKRQQLNFELDGSGNVVQEPRIADESYIRAVATLFQEAAQMPGSTLTNHELGLRFVSNGSVWMNEEDANKEALQSNN